jgi:hypothetical protein
VYPLIVARQLFGKNPLLLLGSSSVRNVTMAMNTHIRIEELLDTSFPMQSVSYQVVRGIVCGPEGAYLAGGCVLSKSDACSPTLCPLDNIFYG